MNAEFNWWLLIVGVAAGAGLAWLLLADLRRNEDEIAERERRDEADWIADTMTRSGRPIKPETAQEVLRLHREFLSLPPSDAEASGAPELPIEEEASRDPRDDGRTKMARRYPAAPPEGR